MGILNYIRGQRKGKEAHRIERDSMLDPFLYEAIEGFDSIDDNHIERIENIRDRIRTKTRKKNRYRSLWQTAATVAILVLALGGYFLNDMHKSDLHAQTMMDNKIIDIYIPEVYYAENIVPIAKQNAKVARDVYKPNISKFKANKNIDHAMSEEDMNAFSDKNKQDSKEKTIDIYIPENIEK